MHWKFDHASSNQSFDITLQELERNAYSRRDWLRTGARVQKIPIIGLRAPPPPRLRPRTRLAVTGQRQ